MKFELKKFVGLSEGIDKGIIRMVASIPESTHVNQIRHIRFFDDGIAFWWNVYDQVHFAFMGNAEFPQIHVAKFKQQIAARKDPNRRAEEWEGLDPETGLTSKEKLKKLKEIRAVEA